MKIPTPTRTRLLLTILAISIVFVVLAVMLVYLSIDINQANQAVVLASFLGAFGTVTLALATLFNVLQTSRVLELREREWREPLAVDEISYFIEPAILALEKNLSDLTNPRHGGCAYGWVYLEESKLSALSRGPIPVQYANTLELARFEEENPEVYELLRTHDQQILNIAKAARQFHDQVAPKVEELLIQEDLEEHIEKDMKVLTSAILKEVDHFGENQDLYDFWEVHGNELIQHAKEHPDPSLEDLKNLEDDFRELCEDAIKQTHQWKYLLQEKYGISDEDLHEIERPPEVI